MGLIGHPKYNLGLCLYHLSSYIEKTPQKRKINIDREHNPGRGNFPELSCLMKGSIWVRGVLLRSLNGYDLFEGGQ